MNYLSLVSKPFNTILLQAGFRLRKKHGKEEKTEYLRGVDNLYQLLIDRTMAIQQVILALLHHTQKDLLGIFPPPPNSTETNPKSTQPSDSSA